MPFSMLEFKNLYSKLYSHSISYLKTFMNIKTYFIFYIEKKKRSEIEIEVRENFHFFSKAHNFIPITFNIEKEVIDNFWFFSQMHFFSFLIIISVDIPIFLVLTNHPATDNILILCHTLPLGGWSWCAVYRFCCNRISKENGEKTQQYKFIPWRQVKTVVEQEVKN